MKALFGWAVAFSKPTPEKLSEKSSRSYSKGAYLLLVPSATFEVFVCLKKQPYLEKLLAFSRFLDKQKLQKKTHLNKGLRHGEEFEGQSKEVDSKVGEVSVHRRGGA
jgi:hypothetical protein